MADDNGTNSELTHYGVPGMRWGKRRAQGKAVLTSKPKAPHEARDHKDVKKLRGKSLSQMNNADIKKLNTRLQLEKQYKELNPSVMKKGQKKVAATLATIGTINGLLALNNSPAGKLVKSFIANSAKETVKKAPAKMLQIGR